MDESLATFFHMWITVKIVDWLLSAVFEERRTEQICCHAAPDSTLAKLFQHAAFKTTALKLATSCRTYTFNSGQVLFAFDNSIEIHVIFDGAQKLNSELCHFTIEVTDAPCQPLRSVTRLEEWHVVGICEILLKILGGP